MNLSVFTQHAPSSKGHTAVSVYLHSKHNVLHMYPVIDKVLRCVRTCIAGLKCSVMFVSRSVCQSVKNGHETGYTWAQDRVHMGKRQGTHGHETGYTWTRDWVHMGTRQGTHGHETGYTWTRDWVHMGMRQGTHGHETGYTRTRN